jgi:hypothetical protein
MLMRILVKPDSDHFRDGKAEKKDVHMQKLRWFVRLTLLLGLSMIACGKHPIISTTPSITHVSSPTQISTAPSSCAVFPSDNIWNTDISQLPTDSHSSQYIANMGPNTSLHPDFGTDPSYGIPYNIISGNLSLTKIVFALNDESDPGPYPIPSQPIIESGSDHHMLLVDSFHCKLYELYAAQKQQDGMWQASNGAIWNLRSNALRPQDWTSADAAGLPIFPGLVRYDELAQGSIHHALRFTMKLTQSNYIWPARHKASTLNSLNLPPMGLRLRLKPTVDISRYPPQAQIILTALKRYGMMVADNGSSWFLTGAPDSRWNDDELNQLKGIKGSDFEVVNVSSLMIEANSGSVRHA